MQDVSSGKSSSWLCLCPDTVLHRVCSVVCVHIGTVWKDGLQVGTAASSGQFQDIQDGFDSVHACAPVAGMTKTW